MEDKLRLKCHVCSAVLVVRNMPKIETKSIACPICKTTSKYEEYEICSNETPKDDDGPRTQLAPITDYTAKKCIAIGKLQHIDSEALYPLNLGINIIGRKSATSSADVQIETDDKTVSRLHIAIEVVELQSGGHKHYLSNANNKNTTMVNDHKVENDDKLILNSGDIIKMANVSFRFIAEKIAQKGDEDMTTVN